MTAQLEALSLSKGLAMPRGKKPSKTAKGEKTFALRFQDAEFEARIEAAARTLGMDPSNFLRWLVRENFPRYEKRAEAIERGDAPE